MRDIPFYPQETEYYCGPAVVEMIAHAHGLAVTQEEVARAAGTNPEVGTLPEALANTIQGLGLVVEAAQHRTLAEVSKALKEEKIVVVLFIEPEAEVDHYAIIKEIRDNLVILIDSDARSGTTEMLAEEFERRWKDNFVGATERWAAFVG
jgi:ABC-type bacteriocin/lantibiotic exporter with double-glycine peptidase domain